MGLSSLSQMIVQWLPGMSQNDEPRLSCRLLDPRRSVVGEVSGRLLDCVLIQGPG